MKSLIQEYKVHYIFEFTQMELARFYRLYKQFNVDNEEGEHDPKPAITVVNINTEGMMPIVEFHLKAHMQEAWEGVFFSND